MSDTEQTFEQYLAELASRPRPPQAEVVAHLCRVTIEHEVALRGIVASLLAAGVPLVDIDPAPEEEAAATEPEEETYTRLCIRNSDGSEVELGPPPRDPWAGKDGLRERWDAAG